MKERELPNIDHSKRKKIEFNEGEKKMIYIILERCKNDIEFRELMLENPLEALKEYEEYEEK